MRASSDLTVDDLWIDFEQVYRKLPRASLLSLQFTIHPDSLEVDEKLIMWPETLRNVHDQILENHSPIDHHICTRRIEAKLYIAV